MAPYNTIWSEGTEGLEVPDLWPDQALRLDAISVHLESDPEHHLIVTFTLFHKNRPEVLVDRKPGEVRAEWISWFRSSGLGWAVRDSAGSTFDTRVFDVFSRPDRDSIGGVIEIAGFMPEGLETGFEPHEGAWPPRDLQWIDLAFDACQGEEPRVHGESGPVDLDDERWFVVRVPEPLSLLDRYEDWPFRHGWQEFPALRDLFGFPP